MDTEEFLKSLLRRLEYYAVCFQKDGNEPVSDALQVMMTCVVQAAVEVAPKGSAFYQESESKTSE
jgi:hypothetical protein